MCAVRVLYHLLADENRSGEYAAIEGRLLGLVNGGLEYFLLLSSEVHTESWTPVLLLILTRILQLQPHQVCSAQMKVCSIIIIDLFHSQFKHHMSYHYHLLCQMLSLDLKYEVRALLRRVFTRVGLEFGIVDQQGPQGIR